jgi:hypothetical protein
MHPTYALSDYVNEVIYAAGKISGLIKRSHRRNKKCFFLIKISLKVM